jgi:pyridoxal phosphate enzyme (YggS family)
MSDARRDELAERLDRVRSRVDFAASEAGRSPDEVTLVVVTKTWPASDVRRLHDLGVRDFGENRAQEAEDKAAEVTDLPLTWHFVGQVQSNKAQQVAAYTSVVHSVSSARVASRLDAGAHRSDRWIDCLVQINLDPDGPGAGRGGVSPSAVADVAAAVGSADRLRLVGVMGVAPLRADPVPAYRRLAALAAELRERHPDATKLSAGMSGDFEAAIGVGATHVRVGSAILGERPPNR